jgi:hypothetical protein
VGTVAAAARPRRLATKTKGARRADYDSSDELLTAVELSGLLRIGLSTFQQALVAGAILAPVSGKFTTRMLWRTGEVRAWIQAGCPRRDDWHWPPAEGGPTRA